jgi:hypothetical protein
MWERLFARHRRGAPHGAVLGAAAGLGTRIVAPATSLADKE